MVLYDGKSSLGTDTARECNSILILRLVHAAVNCGMGRRRTGYCLFCPGRKPGQKKIRIVLLFGATVFQRFAQICEPRRIHGLDLAVIAGGSDGRIDGKLGHMGDTVAGCNFLNVAVAEDTVLLPQSGHS